MQIPKLSNTKIYAEPTATFCLNSTVTLFLTYWVTGSLRNDRQSNSKPSLTRPNILVWDVCIHAILSHCFLILKTYPLPGVQIGTGGMLLGATLPWPCIPSKGER